MNFHKTSAAIAAASLIGVTAAFAQTPPPPPPPVAPTAPLAASQVVSGTVQQWLLNPNGEVDGLLLTDGTQVGFAPHLSAALTRAIALKDSVQVTGWRTASGSALRAQTIRSTTSGRSVSEQPPEAGAAPPAPREPGALTEMMASSRIARVLVGPMGEAQGAIVDNGSIVRFPPHVGALLGDSLKVGAPLYARGYGTRNAWGSAFEATRIGATAETARDTFGPPQGPLADARGAQPGPRARPRPPAGERPRPPAGDAPPPAPDGSPPVPPVAPR